MPHCQICLSPVPHHASDCPVKTGKPVMAMNAATHQHDPTAIELRIEWLEKEVHLLRARIAKLERAP